MNNCRICNKPLTNPRRVLCGDIECDKEDARRTAKLHYEEKGGKMNSCICRGCGCGFKSTNQTTQYCETCNVYYHEQLGSNDERCWNGARGHYQQKVEYGIHGPVPKDIEIHHIDLNNRQNTFENFALLSKSDHTRFHRMLQHMNVIHRRFDIPMTDEWKRFHLALYAKQTGSDVKVFCDVSPEDEELYKKFLLDKHPAAKETFCSCGKRIDNSAILCTECHLEQRRHQSHCPSKEQLASDIASMNWCAVGRKYGVSDNAVRKWARNYGLI